MNQIINEQHPYIIHEAMDLDNTYFLHGLDEKQDELYQHLICHNRAISPALFHQLCKYIEDLSAIKVPLDILRAMGFSFELALVGGCVRDSILDCQYGVKDLDILLTFDDEFSICNDVDKNLELECNQLIQKQFNWETPTHWNEKTTNGQKFYDIVYFFISKFLCIEKGFKPRENIVNEEIKITMNNYDFTENRLRGVIKINDASMHFPVDILFSNYSCNKFIGEFDVDLCKCAFPIDKEMNLTPRKMLNSLDFAMGFLDDILDKKITLRTENRNCVTEIIRSLEDHIPRVQKKYPSHELEIIIDSRQEVVTWWNYYQLDNYISKKTNDYRPSKTKI